MTDMSPIAIKLTPDRAKSMLEAAGASEVYVKVKPMGKMWAFFTYWGKGFVLGIRSGAFERNFARDVEREFRTANERAA